MKYTKNYCFKVVLNQIRNCFMCIKLRKNYLKNQFDYLIFQANEIKGYKKYISLCKIDMFIHYSQCLYILQLKNWNLHQLNWFFPGTYQILLLFYNIEVTCGCEILIGSRQQTIRILFEIFCKNNAFNDNIIKKVSKKNVELICFQRIFFTILFESTVIKEIFKLRCKTSTVGNYYNNKLTFWNIRRIKNMRSIQ